MMERELYTYLRKFIFPIICTVLFCAMALHGAGVLWAAPNAAPNNQTIPPPTFTPENTPVPTATPADDDDDSESPTPTPTDDFFDSEPDDDSDQGDASDEGAGDSGDGATSGSDAGNTSADSGDADATLPSAVVSAIVLNVRSGPGVDFAVMGTSFQDDTLRVSGRSGDWWRVCCAIGTTEAGWVDSQFLEPDFDIDELVDLVPEITVDGAANSASASDEAGVSTAAANDSTIEFVISHDPAFIWQGSPFTMSFTVTNTSDATAENVRIRDEFPPEVTVLGVIESNSDDGDVEIREGADDNSILVASWLEIDGGESRTILLSLEIGEEVEMGSIINNLAVVTSDNAADVTAGISIGMPPTRLPSFR